MGAFHKESSMVTYGTIAVIDAYKLFDSGGTNGEPNINWKFCNDCPVACFKHNSACEFIFPAGNKVFQKAVLSAMREGGCTSEFIQAYIDACASGAMYVLFFVW